EVWRGEGNPSGEGFPSPLLFKDFRVYRILVLELFRRGLFLKQDTLQSGNVPIEKSILEFFAKRLFQFPKKEAA
ncbi:hypothetical protein, partial [uncultured Bilophila sp.]|uniref:hypothetical protein n=1 Tax=uncultured Bilophila sp. TaxID=529385 RepID=UPI00266F5723